MVPDIMAEGFAENGWLGQGLAIGSEASLQVAMLDPRCVMTTQPQGDLPQDIEIIRTLVGHNSQAVIAKAGTIQLGDAVTLD